MVITRMQDFVLAVSIALAASAAVPAAVQDPPRQQPAPVEKLGPGLFRVGKLRVDTEKREVTAQGWVNENVPVIEFFANALNGMKAYESAITLDTDAINFNVALVLIGLDRANAKPPKHHFDPAPVSGDQVSISVEYTGPKGLERGPVEKLLFDKQLNAGVKPGAWVYTGSTFYPDGRFAADVEGVLIGFAHTSTSVIESAEGIGLGRYGTIIPHPGVPPGTKLTLRIKAFSGADTQKK